MTTDRILLSRNPAGPHLDFYIPDQVLDRVVVRPFLLVVPGGGYVHCSRREGETIALRAAGEGIAAAVLSYSAGKGKTYPVQLIELAQAMDTIRRRAKEWHVDSRAVYVCGFSAGGHLAASLGVFWNKEPFLKDLDCRPRAIVLCYAVTVSGPYENRITYDMIAGSDRSLREKLSLPQWVDEDTPPTFLWHTAADKAVPVENAILFASALSAHKVPFELHVFSSGPHALALAEDFNLENPEEADSRIASWFPLAISWIKRDFASLIPVGKDR